MKGKFVVPLRHVSVSFCSTRSVNCHTWHHQDTGVLAHGIRNKPWDEGSVLGSQRKGGRLAPRGRFVPKCHWNCWGHFCLIYLLYLRPTTKRKRAEGSPTLAGLSSDGEHWAGWDWRPPLAWSLGVELHYSLPLMLIFNSHKIQIWHI